MQDKPTPRRSYGTGGLTKRSNADGSESWVAIWYQDGRHKKTLGRVGELSEKRANEKLAELRGEPSASSGVRGDRPSIDEVARRYLLISRGGRPRKPSTVENIQSEVRLHLVPFFGEKPVDRITADDVVDLIAALGAKGLAPKSIRNFVGTLSALLNFAAAPRRGWVTSNVAAGAELPALDEATEIRFLTVPEVRRLIEHASPGPFQALDQAMYLTAAMTGLRRGELLALRWRDVDWTAGRIRVRQNYVRGRFGTPKSRRSSRSVPLADEIGGELDRLFQASSHQGDDDLVFGRPVTGEPQNPTSVPRRFDRALEAAGLDPAHRFHDLRHTFGTRMAAVGTPIRTLQEWLGHKDLATTQRYADYAPSGGEADLIATAFGAGTSREQFERISDDLSDPRARKHGLSDPT